MRITYDFSIQGDLPFDDEWPFEFLNGTCELTKDDLGMRVARVSFSGMQPSLSPAINDIGGNLNIKLRDTLLPIVQEKIERAFSYLKCMFDIDVDISNVKTYYYAENDQEKEKISVFSFSMGKRQPKKKPLSYSLFTGAVMAAEKGDAPLFIADLIAISRRHFLDKRFIDSFRYSFILIESLYGNGKFRKEALSSSISSNDDFRRHVLTVLSRKFHLFGRVKSDTHFILKNKPSVEIIASHMVEKRGLYFHGNLLRQDRWESHRQEEAEALALLAFNICQEISADACKPMFKREIRERHFTSADRARSIVMINIVYTYLDIDTNSISTKTLLFKAPGTKLTKEIAFGVGRDFINQFETKHPSGYLIEVRGHEERTGEFAFSMNFSK